MTKICIYIYANIVCYIRNYYMMTKTEEEIMSRRRPKNNPNVGERCCRATVLSRATESPSLRTLIFNTAVCKHLPVNGNCRTGIHVCSIYHGVARSTWQNAPFFAKYLNLLLWMHTFLCTRMSERRLFKCRHQYFI